MRKSCEPGSEETKGQRQSFPSVQGEDAAKPLLDVLGWLPTAFCGIQGYGPAGAKGVAGVGRGRHHMVEAGVLAGAAGGRRGLRLGTGISGVRALRASTLGGDSGGMGVGRKGTEGGRPGGRRTV